ncbi:MAG: (Fe-S)-binding protein, partial [Chloroflexota bacterium]
MPLTGIEIFKLLPKTNCGECGVPTCLAFAMALAAGKASLSSCTHVSEEAKARLQEAAQPPIRAVTIGSGENKTKVGGETVLFRHEKRFENPPGIAILVSDTMPEAEVNTRLEKFKSLSYIRVGLTLRPELVAVKSESGDESRFTALVTRVKESNVGSLILMSQSPEVMAAGLKVSADRKPLIYAATRDNFDRMVSLAKERLCPLAVKGQNLEELTELVTQANKAGVNDL